MKINVIYNKSMSDYTEALETIENTLIDSKLEFKSFELNKMETFGDFSLVIGGDGTLLRAARFYSDLKTPVLGINLGRLGFLSQAGADEIKHVVRSIVANEYTIEDRLMLESKNSLALNDFVIKGCSHSRTSKFFLEINEKIVCDYIADGLIIATPTGSTAYGLSAGGPVLHPALDAVVIVPICPHTLNARPLVVPSGEAITVKTSDCLLSVSVDGQEQDEFVEKITITAAKNKAKLAFLDNESFYSVLRNKLHWGVAPCASCTKLD